MRKNKSYIIINIILLIVAGIIIVKLWNIYKLNDFKEFTRAEGELGKSQFSRDDKIKVSKVYSYKITSETFNDALIYKNIKLEKNTPYKVTAMVKYENVENELNSSEGGVNIGIMDTMEKSDSYVGTEDWKTITFEFNSKDRENVNIAFRLGSYDDKSKGTVWFTNFKIEKGLINENTNWNCALFIMKNINVSIKEKGIESYTNLSLKNEEIDLLKRNMERFKHSMKELSRRCNDNNI